MIHIDRTKVAVPAALDGPASAGGIELTSNAKLAAKNKHAAMKFEAYRHDSVKDALKLLFNRKCAYCEVSLLAVTPDDIEHYRPKGKVSLRAANGRLKFVDGYYWLAADWDNLLTSCPDCNRPRQQDMVNSARRVLGKANWFPVADEKKRARKANAIAKEPRLLLNPCFDDPDQHLAFTDDGGIEARHSGGKPSAMGATTIEVCGLHRSELLQARAKHRKYVMLAIRAVMRDIKAGRKPDNEDVDVLRSLVSAREELSAYATHLVRTHMAATHIRKLKLFTAGEKR